MFSHRVRVSVWLWRRLHCFPHTFSIPYFVGIFQHSIYSVNRWPKLVLNMAGDRVSCGLDCFTATDITTSLENASANRYTIHIYLSLSVHIHEFPVTELPDFFVVPSSGTISCVFHSFIRDINENFWMRNSTTDRDPIPGLIWRFHLKVSEV